MTTRGQIELDCIATQVDTGTLHGIATATGKDDNGVSGNHIVLVKSNPSPSNLASITWSVVSTTPNSQFSYDYPAFTTVDCAVSTTGEFTALFPNTVFTSKMSLTLPMGVRYDPIAKSWSSIRGSPLYGWTWTHAHQSLYSTGQDSMGNQVESLTHLIVDVPGKIVKFATVDAANSMLQPAAVWTQTGRFDEEYSLGSLNTNMTSEGRIYTFNGFLSASFPSPEHQFTLGRNRIFEADHFNTIRSYPFTSAVQASPETFLQDFNAINITSDFKVHSNMVSVGGRLPGQEPFAVALTTKGLYELQMFGPTAGNLTGPVKVSIYPTPLYSTAHPEFYIFKRNSSKFTSWETFGIVAGALIGLAIVLLCFRCRRNNRRERREAKRKQDKATAVMGRMYAMGMIPKIQIPSEAAIEVGFGDNSEGLSAVRDDPLSTALVPEGSRQALVQTYQDEIQGLQLSSHPRPNIITSVGDSYPN
ncbi:hypothetical protein BGW39_009777 [Mortierella sp. 14UC]|nr:hypothetical protein BGW39_009777 [Mortierella sp. 14UC]